MSKGARNRHTRLTAGPKVEVNPRQIHATLETPQPGEHLWTVAGMWRVIDPTHETLHLDTENLLTIEGPGCFVCEKRYTPELAARPCSGEPSG